MIGTSRLLTLLVACGVLGGGGNAFAAEVPVGVLARIAGTAIVNQGAQYVSGREGMQLVEGDRLLVLEGGSALVVFSDGCQRAVEDDELLVVPAVSTCAAGDAVAGDPQTVESYSAVAEGDGVGTGAKFQQAALTPLPPPPPPAPAASFDAMLPAVGGLLVGVGAVIDHNVNDDRKKISN
ncbi:hypothetical protein Thimo_2658 [Thioflavicoccus mobilis 8321]|uniref:Uncharacterized protein n=1 Tax=Thioflavicoccus mobilis 8321 TaxID=765912 RepID=L0GX82_9GAMM|nr:hypothetical protein [Thioflavicoccus mobilis]AGA91378.1 hypothetical protein Thimo_2658 [Thioflavicoccus mobilis 8321]